MVGGAGLTIEKYFTQGFYWLIWLCFNWVSRQKEGRELNTIAPPYNELSQLRSTTWHGLLKTQGGPELKRVLDTLLPTTQGVIARKP